MIKDILTANESVKPNNREMEVLNTHFPQCFNNEGKFDIDKFQSIIKENIDVTYEGESFNFLGKGYAKLLASTETTTIIQPDIEHNSKSENVNSENLYISGDNLDALKHLLKSYAGKVKCIYIDPPYNTGSDGFVYNDNFNFKVEELSTKLSISEERAAKILDLTRRGSASHAAWLTFMLPRLQLAKDLLTSDGVIFISIDDNEQANLKLLCDNIFGEENALGVFIVNSTPNARDYGHIGKMHEFVLFYGKNREQTYTNMLKDEDKIFKYLDDNGGYNIHPLYNSNEAFTPKNRPNLYYPFYLYPSEKISDGFYKIGVENKEGSLEIFPPKSLKNDIQFVWRWGKDKSKENLNKEIIGYKTSDGEYRIVQKMRHTEKIIRSILNDPKYSSRRGTAEVEDIFNSKVFSFPKPLELLNNLIETGSFDDSIIVDFFAGSSTTAHSVMHLNAKYNSRRKYIMVQLPEIIGDCKYKTIDQIGIERIKRSAKKIKEETGADIDYGFKHYTLVEPSNETIDKMELFNPSELFADENNILTQFGADSVLETWLVKDGYGFGAKVDKIILDKYTAYHYEKHLYFIDTNLTELDIISLIDKYNKEPQFNPENIVIFGYSFLFSQMDTMRSNLAILKDSAKNLKINIDVRY